MAHYRRIDDPRDAARSAEWRTIRVLAARAPCSQRPSNMYYSFSMLGRPSSSTAGHHRAARDRLDTKPTLIIETGVAHVVADLYASLFELMKIDVRPSASRSTAQAQRRCA